MIGSRRSDCRIDNPDVAIRVGPQKLRRATTDTVIPRDPSTDEYPAPFPLRKRKRLEAGSAGKFAAGVFGRVDGERQFRHRERGQKQREGRELGHVARVDASAASTSQISRKERFSRVSQARATNPVIFATAKLIPFRLRSGG